jgi:hypothetical protein
VVDRAVERQELVGQDVRSDGPSDAEAGLVAELEVLTA